MKIAHLLLPEYDNEIGVTRRVLERVPDDRADWKPHPRAFSMAHLAQLVAMLPCWVEHVMKKTELDIAPRSGPTIAYSNQKVSRLLTTFDAGAAAGRAALVRATDAEFDVPWTLLAAGTVVSTQPRYMALRQLVLNHLVHHRAQLGVYLRITDQKVPQMYGPTADEK